MFKFLLKLDKVVFFYLSERLFYVMVQKTGKSLKLDTKSDVSETVNTVFTTGYAMQGNFETVGFSITGFRLIRAAYSHPFHASLDPIHF